MRVGVFIEEFSPHVGGGYTIQADIFQSLLELATESRHDFTIVCRRPEDLRETLKATSFSAIAYPGTLAQRVRSIARRSMAALGDHRKLQTRLEQLTRDNGIEFMWFVGAEAVQLDTPYCAIVWDLQHRLQPWFPEVSANGQWIHREAFYSQFLRRAAIIIAGTEAGRDEIGRFYEVPSERIKILPHPTPRFALDPTPDESGEILARYGLSPGYLFYPAQFWPHKNHANLLLAISRLREKHGLTMRAVFVGSDKGNQGYIQQLTNSLGLSAQVHFLGFVGQEDMTALYRNALALTYLSFFGPENLPPLEAFGLGCPVIAAKVSGSSEQLGDAALLVEPTNVEEIGEAIKRLHDDPSLAQCLVKRGKERASLRTGKDFVRGVFALLDQFDEIRRCWGP